MSPPELAASGQPTRCPGAGSSTTPAAPCAAASRPC